MCPMKTPGVYIVEKNAFTNSVVEVATAVPAFIGYTEFASNGGKSLTRQPWRITSMSEFRQYFGGAPLQTFEISEVGEGPDAQVAFSQSGTDFQIKPAGAIHQLYYNMMLFFQNGGGPCYIVSVGSYEDSIDAGKLKSGIKTLTSETEPTMLVIPEVIQLSEHDCMDVQKAMLDHCGTQMLNRIAILDVWGGFKDRKDPKGDCIQSFRGKLSNNNSYLTYSSAYYPWLNTSIVQGSDVNFLNVSNKDKLSELLTNEVNAAFRDLDGLSEEDLNSGSNKLRATQKSHLLDEVAKINASLSDQETALLSKVLQTASPLYKTITAEIKNQQNVLPPSAAMAGVYTMVDNSRGVWKAPENVNLNAVVSTTVNISDKDQDDLIVTAQSRPINAIRPVIGEGILVKGAYTLDGKSRDWRSINVRRTMIMLEESVKQASKAYIFEPNTANTWASIESMIGDFLNGIWKRGGLAGSTPGEAYRVSIGLGKTMTPNDVLEGILRISVLVAPARPAEFIEITFQQRMEGY